MFMFTMESNKVLRVWEVLDTNNTAHRAYKRILSRPTMLEVAKNVICLLLWLETIMGVKILEEVSRMESKDTKLSLVVKEVDGLYSYLLDGHDSLPEALIQNIPTIVSLCGEGRLVDFKFFKFHKELISRGVTVIQDTVATIVFNEDLHAMLHRFEDDANSTMVPKSMPAPELMEPFVPLSRTPSEDSRTAFLAFYNGSHDISPQYIMDYFERYVASSKAHLFAKEVIFSCTFHIFVSEPLGKISFMCGHFFVGLMGLGTILSVLR